MLKIKDNVGLKELEKHGIKKTKRYCPKSWNGKIELYGEPECGWFEIWGYDFIDCDNQLETLYDLIKAGLVEKVGE